MGFDEYADQYDHWFRLNPNVLASEVRLVARALGDPGRCLSVGCGSGLFESILAAEHGIAVREGVEPAAGMAAIARRRGLDVEIASAESLPYGEATFDTVLMNGIPAYVASLAGTFGEGHRVLKPGGAIVVCDVPASSSYGILYQLAARVGSWEDPQIRKLAPAHPYPLEFVASAHWRTTEEVTAALGEAGFADFTFQQTLTPHARFSDDHVEEPSPGYERGGYVAIRALRPR